MKYLISLALLCLCISATVHARIIFSDDSNDNNLANQVNEQYLDRIIGSPPQNDKKSEESSEEEESEEDSEEEEEIGDLQGPGNEEHVRQEEQPVEQPVEQQPENKDEQSENQDVKPEEQGEQSKEQGEQPEEQGEQPENKEEQPENQKEETENKEPNDTEDKPEEPKSEEPKSEEPKPEEPKRTPLKELTVEQRYKKAMEEVREGELYYDYIWHFNEIVNNATDFNMINPLLLAIDEELKRPENETDTNDLQILYDGSFEHVGGGHWFTIYYDAEMKTIFVYDSMRTGYVSKRTKEIFKIRYPAKTKIRHVQPKTKQPDGSSCGIFAAAYATAIVFYRDPAKVSFKIDQKSPNKAITLRRHLAKILAYNKLKQFPSK